MRHTQWPPDTVAICSCMLTSARCCLHLSNNMGDAQSPRSEEPIPRLNQVHPCVSCGTAHPHAGRRNIAPPKYPEAPRGDTVGALPPHTCSNNIEQSASPPWPTNFHNYLGRLPDTRRCGGSNTRKYPFARSCCRSLLWAPSAAASANVHATRYWSYRA